VDEGGDSLEFPGSHRHSGCRTKARRTAQGMKKRGKKTLNQSRNFSYLGQTSTIYDISLSVYPQKYDLFQLVYKRLQGSCSSAELPLAVKDLPGWEAKCLVISL
jgi:hypothetical protein